MRRKILLALVLCLAVAALGIGAAPALAAAGCDCHTAVPPTNGATPAHAPFVVAVSDCTVCHVDWVVPHPDAEVPWLNLYARSSASGSRLLSGFVGIGVGITALRGHPGVVVYLQERAWGETAFTDLGQVTTGAKGHFAFTVASPPPFATYRAIAQGHVGALIGGGTALFKAATTGPLPMTPVLRLKLRGVNHGIVKRGHRVTANGTVKPADIGAKATVHVQKRIAGKWVARITVKRAISSTGSFSFRFTPRQHGRFKVWFRTPGNADEVIVWTDARSSERGFRVK